jgi:predicted metal-dependent phosphoesterase TrpH
MIDLHTHSNTSDGSLSPAELIRTAVAGGLSALALTDHETIDGLGEAEAEARIQGIRFIPGIELEISWRSGAQAAAAPSGDFHLLGLGIRSPGLAFLSAIAELSRLRELRNREILGRINEMGLEAEYGDIRALSGGGSIGRPHFAAFLVKRGIVRNTEQAFTRYLARGKPLYVSKDGLDFDEALRLIKEAGGIAVLAHPMSLYIAWGRLPDFIRELAGRGLDGIEAWHPTAKPHACKRLEELGRDLGLSITEGSDFHGEFRSDRKLGFSSGGRRIEEAMLEAIPRLNAP